MGLDLSQKCIEHLQMGKLFATLASQFTQDSFGESSLSQILLMSLQPRLDPAWRLEVGLCVYLLCVCVCTLTCLCACACFSNVARQRRVECSWSSSLSDGAK